MRRVVRAVGVLACMAGLGEAWWLNVETGGRAWTSFPDPALASMKGHEGEVGEVMGGPAPSPIDNEFHLGWLPSGMGREMLSVTSLDLPLVLALAAIAVPARRRGDSGPADPLSRGRC